MKTLGFLTSSEDPQLVSDDRIALPYLKKLGFEVTPVVWDRTEKIPDVDALIFRSCWNYHKKYAEFRAFLSGLKKLEIPIFNPLSVIEWNLDKSHIVEYEARLLVPKTKVLRRDSTISTTDLKNLADSWSVEHIVVKPAVSLNGQDTYLLETKDFAGLEKAVREILKTRDVLVQEFIPEIQTQGETSLIFFNGKFSHAVRKVPAPGEFRVHSEYGGSRLAAVASPTAINYGNKVLAHLGNLLYARVDIVESKRGPILIEIEVTDPMFYLATQDIAAQNFAAAIAEILPES